MCIYGKVVYSHCYMNGKVGKNKKAKRPNPMLHPRYRRWKIDHDYLGKLTAEDQQWLAQFDDEYYAGDHRYTKPMMSDDTQRLAIGLDKRANERDVYALRKAVGELVLIPPSTLATLADTELEIDMSPTPEYLTADEYRDILVEYRKAIDAPKPWSPQLQQRIAVLQMYMQSLGEAE